jgi:hypothetical protein
MKFSVPKGKQAGWDQKVAALVPRVENWSRAWDGLRFAELEAQNSEQAYSLRLFGVKITGLSLDLGGGPGLQ